jgi:hypothetical protein
VSAREPLLSHSLLAIRNRERRFKAGKSRDIAHSVPVAVNAWIWGTNQQLKPICPCPPSPFIVAHAHEPPLAVPSPRVGRRRQFLFGQQVAAQFGQQPADHLPWFPIVTLLTKVADPDHPKECRSRARK